MNLMMELTTVVSEALPVPVRTIEDITISLPGSTPSRQTLQTANLDIRLRLYQDEAGQPLATRSTASLVRRAHHASPRPPAVPQLAEWSRLCRFRRQSGMLRSQT